MNCCTHFGGDRLFHFVITARVYVIFRVKEAEVDRLVKRKLQVKMMVLGRYSKLRTSCEPHKFWPVNGLGPALAEVSSCRVDWVEGLKVETQTDMGVDGDRESDDLIFKSALFANERKFLQSSN